MAESLKLSIITPSYNQAATLEQTITSITGQDYSNVEYIVIDGGSTDGSVDILRRYEKSIAHWVSEPDEGHRYALRKGFARATGDVVAWQNSDDYYEPEVFGEVMRLFAERPDIDLVYGNVRIVDAAGEEIREMRFVPTTYWSTLFGDAFTMHNQAAFFRRTLWDAMGGVTLDDHFFDFDLFLRAVRLARPYFIHRVLGNYRDHAGSMHFSGDAAHLLTDPWEVRRRYMGRWGRLPPIVFKPLTWLSLARRTIWYARLGDWDYIGHGLRNRMPGRRDGG